VGLESTVRNEQKIERNIPEQRQGRTRGNPVHDYIGCQLKENCILEEEGSIIHRNGLQGEGDEVGTCYRKKLDWIRNEPMRNRIRKKLAT
jgi:hypothetical protein